MATAADLALIQEINKYYADPLGYVMFAFPWNTDKEIQLVRLLEPYKSRFPNCEYGPDVWQCEFLDELGEQIRERKFDGQTAVAAIKFATASGHGIGKSVLTSLLIKFIMDTRKNAKGVVTAGTQDQLRTKTWAELGKWHKKSITSHWFKYSAARGNMSLVHPEFPETWRCDAQTCKEENSEAFAGLHSANSTPFYIFDEASGVPDKIFEVRDNGITDGEGMVFDFGNPTKNSGRFYENCIGKFRSQYKVRNIDSRNVQITFKPKLEEDIKLWGFDSDYVKVRIRGVFPAQGFNQFISGEDVDIAMRRPLPDDKYAPLIIGVDCAREGEDESVIFPRIGWDARTFEPRRYKGLKADQLVDKIIETINYFKALGKSCQGLFVDSTGIGGPVCDFLQRYGYNPIMVNFGNVAKNRITWRLTCDEIWGNMREGIISRLCLPGPETELGGSLREQLTQREYGFTDVGNRLFLESKKDLKEKGLKSPDIADALAVTFYAEINSLQQFDELKGNFISAKSDYNPFNTEW